MKDCTLLETVSRAGTTSYRFSVASAAGTHAVASSVARALRPGMVIGLIGTLGAGKTEFVRGLVAALGGSDDVSSPTFVLETVYEVPGMSGQQIRSVRHWDLYRLKGSPPPELFDAPALDDAVTVVEWSERCGDLNDLLSLTIMLAFSALETESEQFRTLTIESPDNSFQLDLT